MERIFLLNDSKSKLEYIKISAPSIYENIIPELEINNIEDNIKSEILIEKSVYEAFELSGNPAIIITFIYEAPAIKKILTKERSITVSGDYKVIDDMCFSNCTYLETIVFEEGVECIKERVAYGSLTLKSVTLPKSLAYIGEGAFQNCENLENVVVKNPETWISQKSFEGTKWFKQFTEDFIVINGQLLKYNGSDKVLNIPEGVVHISHQTFCDNRNVETVVCPSTLKVIWTFAFSDCINLKKVVFNNGLKNICIGAFANCENLKSVELPQSLEEIGAMAFEWGTNVSFYDVDKELTEHIKETYPYHRIIK